MGFKEAVRTVLVDKYANFSGRASLSEYWWFFLFYWLVISVLLLPWAALDHIGYLEPVSGSELSAWVPSGISLIPLGVFLLGTLVPALALVVRRLHDRDLSGWCCLCPLLPLAGRLAAFWLVVITLLEGTQGPNRFGSDPSGRSAAAAVFA